jgi:hypothetical protein
MKYIALIAAIVCVTGCTAHAKPRPPIIRQSSVPALPPHPSSKAISEPTIAAALGDASAADADMEAAATAPSQDALNPEAVVSESQSNTNLQQVSTSPVYQPPTIAEQMLIATSSGRFARN